MTFLSVQDLTKVYNDGTFALRGVSFGVKKGEFVSIMGASGSGKSTLLHILGFLDNPTSGVYVFDDKEYGDYSKDEVSKIRNKKVGFIFQMFNLLPKLSILENVMLPLMYSDLPKHEWKDRAMEKIKEVDLLHRTEHKAWELSGGEKQRVAIARALVNNPEIIFADEPTGNLDSKSGEIVVDILQKLNDKKGHTIILITHELGTAKHAKRIITLSDGEVASDKALHESERFLAGNKKHPIK